MLVSSFQVLPLFSAPPSLLPTINDHHHHNNTRTFGYRAKLGDWVCFTHSLDKVCHSVSLEISLTKYLFCYLQVAGPFLHPRKRAGMLVFVCRVKSCLPPSFATTIQDTVEVTMVPVATNTATTTTPPLSTSTPPQCFVEIK